MFDIIEKETDNDSIKTCFAIKKKIQKDPHNLELYNDLYYMIQVIMSKDIEMAKDFMRWLADEVERNIISCPRDKLIEFDNFYDKTLYLGAYYLFHHFLLYAELKREPKSKFYPPRRKALEEVVWSLQDLEDGKLDLLAVSLPPGVGKTTLAIFYLTWISGRNPDLPNLTASHSTDFVSEVYKEVINIISSEEYLWADVFPNIPLKETNAKGLRLDLGYRKRFQTMQFTSIGSGNAGKYRAENLLYCDDLVSGIEIALSKDRLDKLWTTYTTDLRQRKLGDKCKELHIATRWSVHDVIGRLEVIHENNPKARFINVPAMDQNDESNFDYKFGKGFSTEMYREQREIMDDIDWKALYMNEPIEREGLLYHEDELRRYFELPSGEPDAIIGVCDTKDKGKDYAVLPVGYVYGNDYYIDDAICDNSMPDVLDQRMIQILMKHKVQACRFESNSAGGRVAKDIQEGIKELGGRTNITTKYTNSNKETKIIVNSAWIKEHCLFKDQSLYKKTDEYGRFMHFLTSYTVMGKNKNDDVPDAMAMFSEYAQSFLSGKVEIFKRLW